MPTGRKLKDTVPVSPRRAYGWIFALVAATWPLPAAAQATFHAGTTLVPVFTTVTDEKDRLVPDLSADDFEIFDNGKRQPVAMFANDVVPLTIVVMLDTSASMTAVLEDVKAAAEQFVIRLFPADQARLCVFNDRVRFMSAFTHDRDALAASARDVDFGLQTRLYDATAASLDALRTAADRKVIVILSDGEDTASSTHWRTIVQRARAEDVMVYGIGFESQFRDGDEVVHTTPDPSLRKLAEETGGGYVTVTRAGALAGTFTDILKELHSQYLLAFAPAANDGRVHRLVVQTRNGEHVRARRSYVAASGTPHTHGR